MNDDETPPRGGETQHSSVDLEAVQRRLADKVNEMHADWPEIKALALAWPRIETKLDLALKPTTMPGYARVAIVAGVAALIVMAMAAVAIASRT